MVVIALRGDVYDSTPRRLLMTIMDRKGFPSIGSGLWRALQTAGSIRCPTESIDEAMQRGFRA
jgi:hypothetical protein